jgi:hypothetical protein
MNDKFLSKPTEADRSISTVIDAVSGGLSNPQELVKEVGSVIKHALQGQFMAGLFETWQRLAEKGRVDPDFLNTPHGMATFREILRALELDDTDTARFEAVRNIFLNDALSDDDRNELLVVRMMKIASTLSGSEILIIKTLAEHKELNGAYISDLTGYDESSWSQDLAFATGLRHRDLINQDVASLLEKKLLTQPKASMIISPSGNNTHAPSLSSLGEELYDYIRTPADA